MEEVVGMDKMELLIEETGCDRAQAALALTLTGFDVEKAIRTIGSLLRDIVVVKAKFAHARQQAYGWAILIADRRKRRVVRARAVVSSNPVLFENPLTCPWHAFERSIYAERLADGTKPQASLAFERGWGERLELGRDRLYALLDSSDHPALTSFLAETVAEPWGDGSLESAFVVEVVDLHQFRRGAIAVEDPLTTRAAPMKPHETVLLDLGLVEDDAGVPIERLRAGDSVRARVTDARDIALYLARLLGSVEGADPRPFDAPIETLVREDKAIAVHVRLSPTLRGVARVALGRRVCAREANPRSWWRRFLPFRRS